MRSRNTRLRDLKYQCGIILFDSNLGADYVVTIQ